MPVIPLADKMDCEDAAHEVVTDHEDSALKLSVESSESSSSGKCKLGYQFLCNKNLPIEFHFYTHIMCTGDSEVWEDLDEGLSYELDFEPASVQPSLPDATPIESQSQKALVMWVVGFLILQLSLDQ